jgi:hypothetical protein
MNRKEYRMIAEVISKHKETMPPDFINDLCYVLQIENASFSREKFIKAIEKGEA